MSLEQWKFLKAYYLGNVFLFSSVFVCVANDSSLCCNCYPLQVVPGSGHILSNFIILTLENELKIDVVT